MLAACALVAGLLGPRARAFGPEEQDGEPQPLVQLGPGLKVQEFSGEFARLKDQVTIDHVAPMTFHWTWPGTPLQGAEMHLEVHLIAQPRRTIDAPELVFTTSQPVTNGTRGAFFDLDFSGFLPAEPSHQSWEYEVRVFPVWSNDGHAEKGPWSNPVLVHYRSTTAPPTDFSDLPDGYRWIREGRLDIDLDELYCGNPNDGNGDEPYLLTAVIVLDGHTVDLNHPEEATARIFYGAGTHGNLGVEDVPQGTPIPIPDEVGKFSVDLKPIPLPQEFYDLAEILRAFNREKGDQALRLLDETDLAFVAVLTIGAEEDASPRSAADAAKQVMVDQLGPELNLVLQRELPPLLAGIEDRVLAGEDLSQNQLTQLLMGELLAEVQNLRHELQEAAVEAATTATLESPPFGMMIAGLVAGHFIPDPEVIDPDDSLGSALFTHTIDMAATAWPTYELLNLGLYTEEAAYNVEGRLRVETWSKEVPIYD